jgi:hypothetical protein
LLGQDNLGRPEKDISNGMARLRKSFETIPDLVLPEIQAALVFTDEGATVEAEGAPHPTVHALQLKKLIRKEAKGQDSLPRAAYKAIQDFLGLESIA